MFYAAGSDLDVWRKPTSATARDGSESEEAGFLTVR
jgi:hypothetical protein